MFKKPTRKRSKRFSIRKGGGTPRFAFLGDLQKGKKALQHRKPVQISGWRGGTCARGRTWCLQLTMALPSAWGCQAPRRPPSLKSKRARKSIVLRVSPKLSLLHSALLLFRAPQSLPVFTSVPHHVLCGLGFTAATNHGHASTCDGSTYVLCYFALCHYCVRYLCSHAATFVSHGCVRAQLQLAIHSE